MLSRLFQRWKDRRMSAQASTHRSDVRSAMITFRCSPGEREAIRRRARLAGISMQAFLERIVLDRPDAMEQGLPMTG